jgi:hypothetical protein
MRSRRTFLSCLIAVSYSLAITWGTLFHSHDLEPAAGHCDCGQECGCGTQQESHGEEDNGHDHPRPGRHSRPGQGPTDPCGHDHVHCPVCQFLGQQSVSPEIVEIEFCTSLWAEVQPAGPVCSATGFMAFWHGRAPPQVA